MCRRYVCDGGERGGGRRWWMKCGEGEGEEWLRNIEERRERCGEEV